MANNPTALAPVAAPEVVVANLTSDQMDLVKNTICKGYSDNEMALYLHQCEKLGMDPLARETYTFIAGDKLIIGVGIDGFRKRANDTGCYMPGRPTEYEFDGGKLVSARVYVKRLIAGEWHEMSEDAHLSEFKGSAPIWGTMPRVMLAKCAEARALRRAFPREVGGLYEPAERAAIERNARAPRIKQDPFAPPVDTQAEVVDAPPRMSPKRTVWEKAKTLGLTGDDVTVLLSERDMPDDESLWTVRDVAMLCDALQAKVDDQGGHTDYDGGEPPPVGGG